MFDIYLDKLCVAQLFGEGGSRQCITLKGKNDEYSKKSAPPT